MHVYMDNYSVPMYVTKLLLNGRTDFEIFLCASGFLDNLDSQLD